MARALALAARGAGRTRPNPTVGCVVVADGRAVGWGWHRRAGAPHAEVEALAMAGSRAQGATAYVTLEPCSHFGRTPPCADALIRAGVARVVAAVTDPNPRVAGQGLERLRQAGIEVTLGVGQQEASRLLAPFFSWVTRGRPSLTLKSAASLDGKIATRSGESQWITGPAARTRVQRLRDVHDLVLVGIGTVLADDPQLNCRLPGGRDPVRLVVDSQLRTPPDSRILTSSTTAPTWIATTGTADPDRAKRLAAAGAEILHCPDDGQGRVDLAALLTLLGQRDITSVLSEAGGTLTQALLDARLADRLALFLAPRLIGGRTAPGFLAGAGIGHLADSPWLEDMTVTRLGDDWLLEGSLRYTPASETPCLRD
ncbi:MAG: bifunctional diaminohydroxyphosphoribosylaminopyrimidine deaminase/5-amino-6-(5-phosphoribosylamino)uracil reductase RibD [Magnetococcales bacterium]|nr:bifunctional diaminohydroxyphosphoribosylaminopyrimidine deaminase/5-amino-6-(5-phosphoribosylamino)uracil reductase RibD [Magnetococcales bacterium]